jgi:hypothetical protein
MIYRLIGQYRHTIAQGACQDCNRVIIFEEILQRRGDPDWQKEMILETDLVERAYGSRYLRVERDDLYSDYRDMEWFIGTISDDRLRVRLWGAIRRFKDLLARHPDVEEWSTFKDARLEKRVADWLACHNIEPVQ